MSDVASTPLRLDSPGGSLLEALDPILRGSRKPVTMYASHADALAPAPLLSLSSFMVPRIAADTGSVSLDDIRLVRQMAAGEASALGSFYDRWSHTVYATVKAIVHSAQDAEEIVDDCFWQAWNQAARFDASRGEVRSWLLNIARSRALDRLKAMKRRREEDLDTAPAESFATTPEPEERIDQAARAVQVARALKNLPDAQRQVLEMVYYGGLTQTEIADSTGEALGTIKTRIRLGTQKLRDSIGHLQPRNA